MLTVTPILATANLSRALAHLQDAEFSLGSATPAGWTGEAAARAAAALDLCLVDAAACELAADQALVDAKQFLLESAVLEGVGAGG